MINKYTYSTNNSPSVQKSILDLFFINNSKIFKNLEMIENISETCDHFAIHTILYLPKNN
jgi:hypothetical protein